MIGDHQYPTWLHYRQIVPKKVMGFSDRTIVLAGKGRTNAIIYLDLNKIFDTVLHNFLVSELERQGLVSGLLSG